MSIWKFKATLTHQDCLQLIFETDLCRMSLHNHILSRLFWSETFLWDRVQKQVSFCCQTNRVMPSVKVLSGLEGRREDWVQRNACLHPDAFVSSNVYATTFSDFTSCKNQLALCTFCGLQRSSRLEMDPPGLLYGPVYAYSQYNKHVSPNCLLSTPACWLCMMNTRYNLIDFWLMLNPAHKTHTWSFLHFKERIINPE